MIYSFKQQQQHYQVLDKIQESMSKLTYNSNNTLTVNVKMLSFSTQMKIFCMIQFIVKLPAVIFYRVVEFNTPYLVISMLYTAQSPGQNVSSEHLCKPLIRSHQTAIQHQGACNHWIINNLQSWLWQPNSDLKPECHLFLIFAKWFSSFNLTRTYCKHSVVPR